MPVTIYIYIYNLQFHNLNRIQRIGNIKKPTFILSFLDDPIITNKVIPYAECRKNPNVILGTHPSGGHLGSFEGWKPKSVINYSIYIYIYIVACTSNNGIYSFFRDEIHFYR